MKNSISQAIYHTVIEENLVLYKEIYENTLIQPGTTDYWEKAITMFNDLNETEQEILFGIIRQTMVDTVSHILGIVDGSSGLRGYESHNLHLFLDQTEISGELQDEFLELIENIEIRR